MHSFSLLRDLKIEEINYLLLRDILFCWKSIVVIIYRCMVLNTDRGVNFFIIYILLSQWSRIWLAKWFLMSVEWILKEWGLYFWMGLWTLWWFILINVQSPSSSCLWSDCHIVVCWFTSIITLAVRKYFHSLEWSESLHLHVLHVMYTYSFHRVDN